MTVRFVAGRAWTKNQYKLKVSIEQLLSYNCMPRSCPLIADKVPWQLHWTFMFKDHTWTIK